MSMIRDLISAKVRSNAGCWTCRLRRKKCDEQRPVCEGCRVLEITCHFGEDKPAWMDGGPKQKEMADRIKAQVKKQASQRRDRKYMELLESGTKQFSLGGRDKDDQAQSKRDRPEASSGRNGVPALATFGRTGELLTSSSETDTGAHSIGHETASTPPSSNTSGQSPPDSSWVNTFLHHISHNDDGTPDVDVHFVMLYLDYVFPYLSPFYKPPILSGGRGWVLDSLRSNKSVYYTAISLASYFFAVVLSNGDVTHKECTNRMVDKLQSQLQLGLRELQNAMRSINSRRTGFDHREGLLIMQSIVQMVMFEVATTNEDNWKVHLDAALALFYKILPVPENWTETLHVLYTPKWPPPSMGVNRPWSTPQASLRFYTAHLFYLDVMSSITVAREPRLRRYQEPVIPSCFSRECRDHAQTAGPLFMEEFVGLHNWLIQMIGDVASLDAWKKEQAAAGGVCHTELMSRGQILADAIRGSLGVLEAEVQKLASQTSIHEAIPLVVSDPLADFQDVASEYAKTPKSVAFHNMIWLQATLVYLYVVVFGWQPENQEIKGYVTQLTKSLYGLPSPSCLRGMVWPFCVAGCLSPLEDEQKYRTMLERIGPLRIFGTVKEASDILEAVWARRGQLDESWDIAKCLNILGHGSLLI